MPRVTIVIPCWNNETFLGRTLDSVFAQTLTDWEVVLVDDGSPGDFLGVVDPYSAREPRIRVVRQPNGGPCQARNTGYRAASPESEYMLFLDADDCIEPRMLATLVAELDAHPEAGMAFCDRTIIDARDHLIEEFNDAWIPRIVPSGLGGRKLTSGEAETPFIAFLAYNIVGASMAIVRRSILGRVGIWDETLGPIYDDGDLWLRISLVSTARYVPQRLVRRRIYGAQLTRGTDGEERRRRATRRFETKWKNPTWLDRSDRERVRVARLLREGRLKPYLWFSWARERARRHEWIEAVRCAGRGVRELGLHGPRSLIASLD